MKTNRDTTLTIEDAAQAFAALGSEQRLNVLRALVRAGPDGLSMGALGKATGITGATLTHHLRFLRQSGLVGQARRGRSVICAAVAFEAVAALSRFLLENCCADAAHHAHPGHEHTEHERPTPARPADGSHHRND